MRCVIIDNQDSFTFNLVEMVKQLIKQHQLQIELLVVQEKELTNSDTQQLITGASHIMISPGPLTPQDYPRLWKLMDDYAANKSILGICLGFQLIVVYFGGELIQLANPRHGQEGLLTWHQDYKIFSCGSNCNIDSKKVGLYHSWAINSTLPSSLQLIASDQQQIPMIVAHKQLPIYGVQFHPESYISNYGKEFILQWLTNDISHH